MRKVFSVLASLLLVILFTIPAYSEEINNTGVSKHINYEYRGNTINNSEAYLEGFIPQNGLSNTPASNSVTKKAILIGVTNSGHDHSTCLTNAKPHFENCSSLTSVSKYTGSFTATNIINYLNNSSNKVFLSRSHGGYHNESGVLKYTFINLDDNGSSGNKLRSNNSSLNSADLSNMKLIMFIACNTGRGSQGGNNLPTKVVNKGATCSVGFTQTINCATANKWTVSFSKRMENGESVSAACNALSTTYPTGNLDSYVICGNSSTKLN